jgi:formylglycine-generating enzyme required for sulfatase activity
MTDIFISYKSEERSLPQSLAEDLRQAGYTVWWDMELVGGLAFRRQILERLEAARAVIVIWTPASVTSEFVLDEADHAKRAGKLIPVRVPELSTHDIPLGHRQGQTYPLAERHRIIGALTALGVHPGAAAVATASPANGADEKLWAEVCKAGGIEDYEFYLRRFPKGLHSAEADGRIWQICEADDTAAGYKRYLDLLPEGEHHGVAAYRLERRQALEEQQRREAEERRRKDEQQRKEAEYKTKGFVPVEAWTPQGRERRWIVPGGGRDERHVFREFEHGPEMVVVPEGDFLMGSTPEEIVALTREYGNRFACEGPQHKVTIPAPFAIGRYAVTFAEWDAFAAAKGGYRPEDRGWGRGDRPVINVPWQDAQAYLKWLRKVTRRNYRLPSEAEWEYAARGGMVTPFWWGSSISTQQANYNGNHTLGGGSKGEYREKTVPVKSFDPNPWGLYQVHGNVWEWCEDQWHDRYTDKPEDLKANGGPWIAGDSRARVLRGGSWYDVPQYLRSADRYMWAFDNRCYYVGFRVARTLNI